MEQKEEAYIINRILAGETNLFSGFVDNYGASVLRMVRQIVAGREDAEEIVQDIFMKAFANLHFFKGDARFSTWLFRIAYNTAISATRKKKREHFSFDEKMMADVPDEKIDHFFDNDKNELLERRLQEAIVLLPPDEKALIAMFYNEDKPIDEIASIMSLSASNVKVKLFRTRKKLYLQLNEYH